MEKRTKILVDADAFIFRCGFAAEKTEYLIYFSEFDEYEYCQNYSEVKKYLKESEEYWKGKVSDEVLEKYLSTIIWKNKVVEPVEAALGNLKNALSSLASKFPEGDLEYYLTGKNNFRYDIATIKEYKGNRDPAQRPKHYSALRSFLLRESKATLRNGFEADDLVATRAYELRLDERTKRDYIVVSNDKDLDQIPGEHYDWTKGESWTISEEDAEKVFWTQVLCGDPTDNIPGIISEKKAARVVEDTHPDALEDTILEMYKDKYGKELGETYMIEVMGLVRLRTDAA